MISGKEVIETLNMIEKENLDIRTITMGISLLDCASEDHKKSITKIYDKIMYLAKDLVKTGENISKEMGIPIINKRISVTPISIVAASSDAKSYVPYAKMLDKVAQDTGVDFIGGFSALVHKGYTKGDKILINSIGEAIAETNKVCSSVNVGTTKAGINMDAVREMGTVVKDLAERTKDKDSIGASKLVVFCNAPEDNPFMAGAFHGVGEGDAVINVGVSGPGVVRAAVANAPKDASIAEIAEIIKKTAFKVTRMGQLVGVEASKMLNKPFGIVDLSLAPTPAVGDSVAHILEEIGLEKCGCCGTTACLAMLNDAVKKGGVMASSRVGGLSGAFIPVSEDAGMIDAVEKGALSLEKLEAMTAVCSVGLDMIVVPGDTTAEVISALIADEAAIGMINSKTTAVRVIPAINKKDGEKLSFGGLFGYGPIMPISKLKPNVFINRGGQIPAPLNSLKN